MLENYRKAVSESIKVKSVAELEQDIRYFNELHASMIINGFNESNMSIPLILTTIELAEAEILKR